MNEQIGIIPNAIPLEMCKMASDLIGEGEVGAVGDMRVDQDIRRSNVRFLTDLMEHWDMFRTIVDLVHQANADLYQFSLIGPESIQLTKYDSKNQGHYAPHEDITPFQPGSTEPVRKLSLVIQLTPPECYEGGELIFPNNKEALPPFMSDQGTAIIFPSYLTHGVTPVTKGIRHSLVSWFIGKPFC